MNIPLRKSDQPEAGNPLVLKTPVWSKPSKKDTAEKSANSAPAPQAPALTPEQAYIEEREIRRLYQEIKGKLDAGLL
ncbi:hypothetical protein GCM10007939_03710 [Amylibacter marinus]|uniref:Uncharacterized protein n=1 Tax=Amylibacter marinus TaxID=1475483 RepID=A0ABQ5VRP4_9RHOB|nr:hypothetical protein [Amylibacter marinus]GLQ34088.1 hypothetical protein GCM10007939_03710 [Amylibacter marinus]